jgi:hypothetical protein
MNDQTTKLIESLAAKLGTTADYLWAVLLKQAPVDATLTLIQILIVIAAGVTLYKAHMHLSNDKNDNSYYQREAYGPLMGVLFIGWMFFAGAAFFAIPNVINGYFNPEFWALDYVLSQVKN